MNKAGDAALGFPHPKGFRHVIGSGFPEVAEKEGVASDDPMSARERAAREWVRHVDAGRIGKPPCQAASSILTEPALGQQLSPPA